MGLLMSRRKSYKSQKRSEPNFVMLLNFIADTPAWRSLKPAPRALYFEIKRQYNGHNNGRVLLSYRDAAQRLNWSYNSVGGYFKALEQRGFIVCMQRPHLGPSGVGQTSHWRLTEYECEGTRPTHDYKAWKPTEK